MEKYEVVFKFMKNIVYNLVLTGLLFIVIGVLIYLYPDLLALLVSIVLVVAGLLALIAAARVNKYSQIDFKL